MSLEGKTALVTGGTRGIGRAISAKLVGLGVRVAAVYLRNRAAAEETARDLGRPGRDFLLLKGDVGKEEAVGRMVDIIEKAQRDNQSIFFIGNGGSAAVASHVANDLSANSLVGSERGYRALCLADCGEALTAIAHDSGFENIFLYQLQ